MSTPIKCYHYDRNTSEFLYVEVAAHDPRDNQPLVPAYSTTIEPPVPTANTVALFDGTNWALVADYRGQSFYDTNGEIHTIDSIGVEPLVGWTTEPSLAYLAFEKRNEIKSAYQAALVSTVTVAGIEYQGGYESVTRLDSAKRLAELAGLTTVTFFDINNVGHALTIAEAEAVIIAVGNQVQSLFSQKQSKMVNIDAATDAIALDAIIW